MKVFVYTKLLLSGLSTMLMVPTFVYSWVALILDDEQTQIYVAFKKIE